MIKTAREMHVEAAAQEQQEQQGQEDEQQQQQQQGGIVEDGVRAPEAMSGAVTPVPSPAATMHLEEGALSPRGEAMDVDGEDCEQEWGCALPWHELERAEMRRLANAHGWDMNSDGQWMQLHSSAVVQY